MPTPLDSETKSIIESTLLRFVDECYDPAERHKRLAQSVDYRQYWSTLAELGVLGMPFSAELGGMGGFTLDTADAVSVLAKGLILEPFVDSAVIAGSILASRMDSQEQIDELISGESISILLGGRQGDVDSLKVHSDHSELQLSGSVRVQPYAVQADYWLVAARDAKSGKQLILRIESGPLARCAQSYRMIDGRVASDVSFSDELLPVESLWLEGSEAESALFRAAQLAVCCLCAEAVGVMASLLAITGDYLRTRVQFGVPLSSFQALQHRYADMQMVYLESRAISRKLALCQESEAAETSAWLRFAATSVIERSADKVGHEAIQMHGGMGVTDELVVSHYNNRLVVLVRMLHAWVDQDVELWH
jgi:alkylation response protein AidB-like acyl-CoA dehydrogenase